MSWPLTVFLLCWTSPAHCYSDNIETRIHRVLRPGTDEHVDFGRSLAIHGSTLYGGAPKLNITGGMFSCDTDFTRIRNETRTCAEMRFGGNEKRTTGTVMELVTDDLLLVCGNQYEISCPDLQIEQRMIGECFSYSFRDSVQASLPSLCPIACPRGLIADIAFVVDESGSVGPTNFRLALKWITSVLKEFSYDIDEGNVLVGYVIFENTVTTNVKPSRNTYYRLKNNIESIAYGGGGTQTDLAISAAKRSLLKTSRNVAKIMILLTDGRSNNPTLTLEAATLAKEQNIVIISVGVGGGILMTELQGVASPPISDTVMTVENYDKLDTILDQLSQVISETASTSLEGGSSNATTELTNCQFGTSMHASRNGLYIGAVGAYDRTGTVAQYDSVSSLPKDVPRDHLNSTEIEGILSTTAVTSFKDSYFGYSVTSGTFTTDNRDWITMGAPRYLSRGMVLMYENAYGLRSIALHPNESTGYWQLGGYYGQSVLALDINNDDLDDLLVSEPLYSKTAGYDEGAVFLYMNSKSRPGPQEWASDAFSFIVLHGDSLVGARFGMSMASAGDIDKNGYQDVVIGAPAEELTSETSGAIYVYFSSATGLANAKRQKIRGRSVSGSSEVFKWFGSAIYGGSDFDKNSYSDIAVSAPSSDSVVLLRTRKLISVSTSATVSPTLLDLLGCGTSTAACLSVTVCWQIPSASSNFDMVYNLTLDSLIASPSHRRFRFANSDLSHKSEQIQVGNVRKCLAHGVQMKTEAMSALGGGGLQTNPQATLAVDFAPSHKERIMSEVMNPESSNVQTVGWSITKGCSGAKDVCQHDLSFEATFSESSSSEAIILSGSRTLTMNGTITNTGPDYAFSVKVNITSGNLTFITATGGCMKESPYSDSSIGRTVLNYNSGRGAFNDRMLSNETCHFSVVFNFNKLISTASEPKLKIEGVIFSNAGGEDVAIDSNAGNNAEKYERNLQYQSKIVPDGISSQSNMVVNRTEEMNEVVVTSLADEHLGGINMILTHTYSLHNRGPLGFANGAVKFMWTERTNITGLYLLYLVGVKCEPESACKCYTERKVNPLNIAPIPSSVGDYDRHYTINYTEAAKNLKLPESADCVNSACNSLTCDMSYLAEFSKVSFSLSFKPWIPTFGKDFTSMRVLSSMELLVPNTSVGTVDTIRQLRTTLSGFDSDEPPPEPTSNPLNIGAIIGAVLGGILLLIIVILIMWKAGFFKSKYGKMTREARQSIRQSPGGPEDVADPGESNAGFDNGT